MCSLSASLVIDEWTGLMNGARSWLVAKWHPLTVDTLSADTGERVESSRELSTEPGSLSQLGTPLMPLKCSLPITPSLPPTGFATHQRRTPGTPCGPGVRQTVLHEARARTTHRLTQCRSPLQTPDCSKCPYGGANAQCRAIGSVAVRAVQYGYVRSQAHTHWRLPRGNQWCAVCLMHFLFYSFPYHDPISLFVPFPGNKLPNN